MAAYPVARPAILLKCSSSEYQLLATSFLQPSLSRPSSVASLPRIPKRAGHATLNFAMRMLINDDSLQQKLGLVNIVITKMPMGSATVGLVASSLTHCAATALANMTSRYMNSEGSCCGAFSVGAGILKKNGLGSIKGLVTLFRASSRTATIVFF